MQRLMSKDEIREINPKQHNNIQNATLKIKSFDQFVIFLFILIFKFCYSLNIQRQRSRE